MEAALIKLLSTDVPILAIIKTPSQVGIAGDDQPRPYPKLIIDRIGGDYYRHSLGITKNRKATLALNCWSSDPMEAIELRRVVESLVAGYSGKVDNVGMTILPDGWDNKTQNIEGEKTLFCETVRVRIVFSFED